MAIRKVARLGHPVLRKKGRDLSAEELQSPEIQRLIGDMVETMHEYGGIGLAAPQVHESLQLAVIELESLLVVVNPRITVLDATEQSFWEGCLSIPEIRGLVPRPRKIRVDYLDQTGNPQSIEPEGFLATVFQHELDHLQGVLFLDRVKDTTQLAFTEEYQRYWVRPGTDQTAPEESPRE